MPIYKAESFLARNLQEIRSALLNSMGRWELILVVDASPDRSAEICHEFASQSHPFSVQVLINEKNLGKGATVKRGMAAATGDYRIFNDCDLAYPMSEVFKILDILQSGKSVAIASRSLKDSRYIFSPENFRYLYTRHIASRMLNTLIGWIFLPSLKDTQAGLKGFNQEAADFLFPQLRLSGFSFDLELLHLAHRNNFSIQETPVHFYAQRVTTVDFAVESTRMARDIFRIYYWTMKGKYQSRSESAFSKKADLAS